MTSTTNQTSTPSFSDPFTTTPNKDSGGLPCALSLNVKPASTTTSQESETYTTPNTSSQPTGGEKQTPDLSGDRKNSQGEALKSEAETWKPNFKRVQSWSREEMKRKMSVQAGGMDDCPGEGVGFTEGGGHRAETYTTL